MRTRIARSVPELRSQLIGPCVFVPTMGALHRGHASLIEQGAQLARQRQLAGGCVASIFVNPTQFEQAHDYDRYPRELAVDIAICQDAGAVAVWVPDAREVYPDGPREHTGFVPDVAIDKGLEDAARPGHLVGVCQVVERLLRLVEPEIALFGEKDWQQLQMTRALVAHHQLPVEIVGGKTIREGDGLASASRNVFLAAHDRVRSAALRRALLLAGAQRTPSEAERAMRAELTRSGIDVEYAAVRDARTLEPVPDWSPDDTRPMRALAAGKLGATRILDNERWPC